MQYLSLNISDRKAKIVLLSLNLNHFNLTKVTPKAMQTILASVLVKHKFLLAIVSFWISFREVTPKQWYDNCNIFDTSQYN